MKKDELFIMQKKSSIEETKKVLSKAQRVICGNVVNVAYGNVDSFLKHKAPEWLTSYRGGKLIPEMKNMAVEYTLIQACNRGLLPLKYSLEPTKNKAITYLKLVSLDNKSVFTINQTKDENTSSRSAIFRSELKSPFQSYFNLFDESEDEIITSPYDNYFEIDHGYKTASPSFVVLGMPDENHSWMGRLRLLNQIQLLPKNEATDIKTQTQELTNFNISDFESYISKDEEK